MPDNPLRPRLEKILRSRLSTELENRRAARANLIPFVTYTKPNYIVSGVHRAIAEKLEAVERGEIRRLMIFMPPRGGKSELVSRRFPAWYLGRNPRNDFISASYGADLAVEFGRDVRNIVASTPYQRIFPNVTLAEDSKAKDVWHTNSGGNYMAAGVGGGLTGHGGHILNIDDPVKDRAQAESQTYRDSVWDWFRAVAYTRLQDIAKAAIILTLTRWHEDDLAGRLLNAEAQGTGDVWEKVTFPAITPEGESFYPEQFPVDELKRIRGVIGEYDWASLYEQRPRPIAGSFFTEASLLVDGQPVADPERYDTVFAVLDTAFKTGKQNDGVGVTYFAFSKIFEPNVVLLDWDLRQIEGAMLETWLPTIFQQLEEFSKALKCRHGSIGAWIEDKASGIVLLQQAEKHQNWPVHPIDSKLTAMGKSERALNISGYVHAGRVKMTKRAYERVVTYKQQTKNHQLAQILSFRPGTKDQIDDDLLDTFSYGVAIALGNTSGF